MNDDRHKTEMMLRGLIAPILLLVFLVQAYACRGLYGDGANFLLGILETGNFPWWDRQRIFNHFITKSPAVFAVTFGVSNLTFLRYLFSTWLMLCPLAVWASSFWVLRRDVLFWPIVMLFCFVYYSTDFFSIGEYNLCFALLAFCFVMLVRPLPAAFGSRAALLAGAFFTILDYPTVLFSGSLLLLLVILKPKKEWNGAPVSYRAALAGCFALAIASALWEVIAPRDPNNFLTARNPAALMQDTQFWCSLGYSALILAMFFARWLWLRVALAVGCIGLVVVLAQDHLRLYPFLHYSIRAYMSLALAGCGVVLWHFRTYGQRHIAPHASLMPATLGFFLFLTLSLFDIGMSLDYGQYLESFRGDVDRRSGLVSYEQSGVPFLTDNDRFNWGWTSPLLSVILRDNARQGIILNPVNYSGYQPFDPFTAVPDLNRYYR